MDKKFIFLMIAFFLFFGFFIIKTSFNGQISSFTRASEETDPSATTSLIFAWPLTAKIGNNVAVNIFIRNAKNFPLNQKLVTLKTNMGKINNSGLEISSKSDKDGKASFILTSDSPGIAELNALVDNKVQINQKITVKFE
jgi:hypothetical protein